MTSHLESNGNMEVAHPPKGLNACGSLGGGATDEAEARPVCLQSTKGGAPLFTELPRRLLLVVSYAGERVEREARPLLDPVSELELTPF